MLKKGQGAWRAVGARVSIHATTTRVGSAKDANAGQERDIVRRRRCLIEVHRQSEEEEEKEERRKGRGREAEEWGREREKER